MGKKTKLNLNHLKAIRAYPHVEQFKDLVSNYLDLNEVAKIGLDHKKNLTLTKV